MSVFQTAAQIPLLLGSPPPLIQKLPLRLLQHTSIIRLKVKPTPISGSNPLLRKRRRLLINFPRPATMQWRRRINQQLGLTTPIKRTKPITSLINRRSNTQQPMILQYHNLRILLDHAGNHGPLVSGQHGAAVVVKDRVAAVEAERILCQWRKRNAEHAVCFAGDAVRVANGVDPWMGFMDLRVNGEAGGVDGVVALDYLGSFVDVDEVGDADVAEVHCVSIN